MVRKAKPPGLKRVSRAGMVDLYWACSAEARAAGYSPKTVPMKDYADDPDRLLHECRRLQGEMKIWLAGERRPPDRYDGTIGGLMRLYQTHERSSFLKLKHTSAMPYRHYAMKLEATIGELQIRDVLGLDVMRWFDTWSAGGEHIAAGRFALSVLKAALSFGSLCGYQECMHLREIIRISRFESIRPRRTVMAAEQVDSLRRVAKAEGRPSVAIAAAFQYECALRLFDVIGQWWPLEAAGISAVTHGNRKWLGLQWSDIGADGILRLTPSKTIKSTGQAVEVDISHCGMIQDELAGIAADLRAGPVIVNEITGRPYEPYQFQHVWRRLATKAGIPETTWARDIRASAITESRKAGAPTDDIAKLAGHSSPATTAKVYDRDQLEASRRTSQARQAFRDRNGA